MKQYKRLICFALAAVMLLAGCSAPKLMIGSTPAVAGTVGDREISTGEYLAYLQNSFENIYVRQGYAQYEMYMDVWGQDFDYGTGDSARKVKLSEFIALNAQDTIARQAAILSMMKDKGIEQSAKELEEFEKNIKDYPKDGNLAFGISDENFLNVRKGLAVNERSLFFGLYGKGGKEEVKEEDIKKYFTDNYLSFKIITKPLTDKDGKELDEAKKKEVTGKMEEYLKIYEKDKNFEAVVDAFNKDNAAKDAKVDPSKDEDNRVDVDGKEIEENIAKAVRSVDVGACKIVEYKANGSKPTVALILRLDINNPEKLYTDSVENILSSLKFEDFNKQLTEKAKDFPVVIDKKILKKCKAENFLNVG